jgi:hypothetical protein
MIQGSNVQVVAKGTELCQKLNVLVEQRLVGMHNEFLFDPVSAIGI